MVAHDKRVLILCKTYPSPSAKYAETSCVAGVDEAGNFVRLYPVPFRLISSDKQFKKWQWVSAKMEQSRSDRRPESHKLYVDTIHCHDEPLPTNNNWEARRLVLDKLPVYSDFTALDADRESRGVTLALLRPTKILGLDISPAGSPEWTEEEKAKLVSLQRQAELFDDTDARSVAQLRKLPFDFHYRYACETPQGTVAYKHKIVDWEVGALYWNVRRGHGRDWEQPFREKLESEIPAADLMFLLGTIHRFRDQWLIVSLIYPPRQQPVSEPQQSLF